VHNGSSIKESHLLVTSVIPERDVFLERVDLWVRDALVSGVATFNDLLTKLPGVYPSVAFESARRITASDTSLSRTLTAILQHTGNHKIHQNQSHQLDLPIPHPLDYDWRFSDQTVVRLLADCERTTKPGQTVVLLGVPTVLRAAHERVFDRRVVLLDASETTVDLLTTATGGNALKCDLLVDPLPEIMANCVIGDPPWYPDEMGAFLWAAAKICRVGAYILMSVPPIGTRPTIESERSEIFAWAEQLGLKLVSLEPSALIYQSPLFEINALKVEGVPSIGHDWRRGDLALFSRETRVDVDRPAYSSSLQSWVEECVDGMRWRIRRAESRAFADPKLISIVSGDVLPSVSKRDVRRVHADVWTSGNRVFRSEGKHTLRLVLQTLRNSGVPFVDAEIWRQISNREVSLVQDTLDQIAEIVKLERNENLLSGD
jgi:hypothetical protein